MTGLQAPEPVTMQQAARRIVAEEAASFAKRRRHARRGDAEAIHQMRVATRRLRAALRVFRDELKPPRGLVRRLVRLARRLGRVRDRDVMLALLERHRAAVTGPVELEHLDALLVALRRERRRAARKVARRLAGRHHKRVRRRLKAFAKRPVRRRGSGDPAAPGLLAAVVKLAARIEAAPALATVTPAQDDLHRLRIAFKRLRYVLEFHAGIGGVAYDAELKVARAMQDCLGELHDLDVLLARIRKARGPFAGRWTGLIARLRDDRLALLDRFASLRERWRERTQADAEPDDAGHGRRVGDPVPALEAAPVQLRLVTGARQIASAMIR